MARQVKTAARTALDLKLKQATQPLKRRLLAEVQAADQRYETVRLERRKLIERDQQQLAALHLQIAETAVTESRLEALIQNHMVKLDGQCKRLLDVLRITARNLFYQALEPFKKS